MVNTFEPNRAGSPGAPTPDGRPVL
jgi:hypothetical protein